MRADSVWRAELLLKEAQVTQRREAEVIYSTPSPKAKSQSSSSGASSGQSSGRTYHLGPKSGCYYYSGSGKKVYVDHSFCR